MYWYLYLSVLFTVSLSANISIQAISLHDNSIYTLETDDTVFSGDGIKFKFISDKTQELKIYYGEIEEILSINLEKGKQYSFPYNNKWIILDDNISNEKFIFKTANKIVKTFELNHVSQKSAVPKYDILDKKDTSTHASSVNFSNKFKNLDKRIHNDLQNIKSNTRGEKEIRVFKELSRPVVLVKTDSSIGTGILISNKAEILTNWHVVKDAFNILIAFKPNTGNKLSKNNYYAAKIVKINIEKDLALLQILNKNTIQDKKPIKFSNMDTVEIGQDIYTIGHPLGELWTFSTGLVSQIRIDYNWTTNNIKHQSKYVIQTQNSISRGNSGGPLVNENIELLGLNTLSKNQGQNLNYAISIKDIKDFLKKPNKTIKMGISNFVSMESFNSLAVIKSVKAVDTKGNKILLTHVDANNNGTIDMSLVDIHRDGKWNIFYQDKNENKIYEEARFDKNKNGLIELIYIDKDEDGLWDLIGYDKNEDGVVEKWSNY